MQLQSVAKSMTRKFFFILLLSLLISLGIGVGIGRQLSPKQGLPIRVVADYLHAVLQADRTFYTQHVVERMEAMLLVTATENWREERTLPLPAHSSQTLMQSKGGARVGAPKVAAATRSRRWRFFL